MMWKIHTDMESKLACPEVAFGRLVKVCQLGIVPKYECGG